MGRSLPAVLIFLAAVFATVRVTVTFHPIAPVGLNVFKDFAHVYAGVLIGGWLWTRDRTAGVLALALIAVEVACFVVGSVR